MGEVRDRLAKGDFNTMVQRQVSPGVTQVTLSRLEDRHVYMMEVRNLFQPDELIIWERIIGE